MKRLQTHWHGLSSVFLIFLLSRCAFYMAALFATAIVPEARWDVSHVAVNGPHSLAMHWRFDAIHYYSVAAGGYNFYLHHPMAGNKPEVLYAFFPLFPVLMRATATVLGGLQEPAAAPVTDAPLAMLLAGVLVSNAAALIALWLLFLLACEETGDEELAQRAALYAAIFPLAFFYAVPYADGLFFAASIGTFLAVRRHRWVRAGLWAGIASAARPFGVLLLPCLVLELGIDVWRGEVRGRSWLAALLGLAVAPLGLLLFMFHLWQSTGDPLAFIKVQESAWGRAPRFPLTTLLLGLRYTIHPSWTHSSDVYARTVLHTAVVVGFLTILWISLRVWRPAYVLYGILLFTVALRSPWPGEFVMNTLGRSIMVLFPVYITLAQWGRRPAIHLAILLTWLPLFSLLAALYANWYFVS